MSLKLKIKLLSPEARKPTYGSKGAACFDIYATHDAFVSSGGGYKFATGLAFEIPDGHTMLVFPRSGMSTKQGLRLANCVAVIDSDYRGELFVPLYNDSRMDQFVRAGDRIAQAMLVKADQIDLEEVNELSETIRGAGGFGSTGN